MVKNASYFAFTATPKNKTLEMFGKKKRLPDGTTKPEPHYVYTMKQAIEEGFNSTYQANHNQTSL